MLIYRTDKVDCNSQNAIDLAFENDGEVKFSACDSIVGYSYSVPFVVNRVS